MILMKNLRKITVTNAENDMLVQKFEKKTWKKLILDKCTASLRQKSYPNFMK